MYREIGLALLFK